MFELSEVNGKMVGEASNYLQNIFRYLKFYLTNKICTIIIIIIVHSTKLLNSDCWRAV